MVNLKAVKKEINILDSAEPFDVCIIGSGFVGTILGKSLVEHGVRTVILESGQSLIRWLVDRRIKDLAVYETCGGTDYPRTRTTSRVRGGNSNFWTGRTERFRPSDFEDNSYTPKDSSWPVTYAEMDPYYERAENTLRVRGEPLSDYYPPRGNGRPLLPGSNISPLREMMARVGITVDNSPTATPKRGWHTFRMIKELLPDFVASENGLLVSGMTVTRLIPNSDGLIVGAEARTLDGETKVVKARLYIVACGGIESPRLLLLSRSETFQNGIGNTYDRVGRGFNEHPGVNFYGSMNHSWSTIFPSYYLGRTHQFYDEFKREGLGGVLPVFIQSWFFPNHLMTFKVNEIPGKLLYLLSRLIKAEFYIGASIEMEVSDENRVTLSNDHNDRFGNPVAKLSFDFTEGDRQTLVRTRKLIREIFSNLGVHDIREGELTWSRHHIGTCRMGDNPRTSVVDRNLRVHESPNLYVGGCETFVTGGAVPPTLTTVALSHRLADHLIMRLKK